MALWQSVTEGSLMSKKKKTNSNVVNSASYTCSFACRFLHITVRWPHNDTDNPQDCWCTWYVGLQIDKKWQRKFQRAALSLCIALEKTDWKHTKAMWNNFWAVLHLCFPWTCLLHHCCIVVIVCSCVKHAQKGVVKHGTRILYYQSVQSRMLYAVHRTYFVSVYFCWRQNYCLTFLWMSFF